MNTTDIIQELKANGAVFTNLLAALPSSLYQWKPNAESWSLLEIICHLHDVEGEDFRDRLLHILETPNEVMPEIFPSDWVKERKYMEQDFSIALNAFIAERDKSVAWLASLKDPKWDNFYQHPDFGSISAKMFLHNWLVHDLLHIRQIVRVKYAYLEQNAGVDLSYAGNW